MVFLFAAEECLVCLALSLEMQGLLGFVGMQSLQMPCPNSCEAPMACRERAGDILIDAWYTDA